MSRGQAGMRLVLGIAAAVIGVGVYDRMATFEGNVIAIELGGSGQPWQPAGAEHLSNAVLWDFVLIAGYGLALILLCDLGRRVFISRRGHQIAVAGLACAVISPLADVVANVGLLVALQKNGPPVGLTVAASAAVLKFSTFAVAAPVGLVSATTTAWRLLVSATRPPPCERAAPMVRTFATPVIDPRSARSAARDHRQDEESSDRWVRGFRVPGIEEELEDRRSSGQSTVGFCVSGGGIRSAAVTLGALQGLRQQLIQARYLVSVSGGGYTAGALQLALQPLRRARNGGVGPPAVRRGSGKRGGTSAARPRDVLAPGSLEEDHLRRHSKYIADGAGQWLVALGVILRGLLFSLGMLFLAVMTVGLLIGLAYWFVPLVEGRFLRALRAALQSGAEVPSFPVPSEGVAVTLVTVAFVAVLLYLISLWTFVQSGRKSTLVMRSAMASSALLVLVALLGVGLPALMWASVAVPVELLGKVETTNVATAGLSAVALSYVVTAVGILWRQRKTIGDRFKTLLGKASEVEKRASANGLVPRLLVLAGLAVLASLFLIVFGGFAVVVAGVPMGANLERDLADLTSSPAVWVGGIAAGVLVQAWALVDQTWVSMHPFYRRRLASAFAVRRVRGRDGASGARPYDYGNERTELSVYGKRVSGFPEVVFAASANLSGQERTPPGRRAVSFTQTASWIGGPDIGYAATPDLEQHSSDHIRSDLTVQAAVAVSGAAFASAMGRQARAYQTFFALTNARLGTWLPNPGFAQQWSRARKAGNNSWQVPPLPRIRRLSYLIREVLGWYPHDDRFLFISDGGHYENLGLVELLRRRCTYIYCIDASGDTPPVAKTLAEAIDLAYEELGVRISLDDQWSLVPGGAEPIEPPSPLAALNGRLSRKAVISGKVVYPAESGLPEDSREGTIVIAKALLTKDMPYPVLAHAVKEAAFPNDSTADQWFDHTQFTAYSALGRDLAHQVHLHEEQVAQAQIKVPEYVPKPTTLEHVTINRLTHAIALVVHYFARPLWRRRSRRNSLASGNKNSDSSQRVKTRTGTAQQGARNGP